MIDNQVTDNSMRDFVTDFCWKYMKHFSNFWILHILQQIMNIVFNVSKRHGSYIFLYSISTGVNQFQKNEIFINLKNVPYAFFFFTPGWKPDHKKNHKISCIKDNVSNDSDDSFSVSLFQALQARGLQFTLSCNSFLQKSFFLQVYCMC